MFLGWVLYVDSCHCFFHDSLCDSFISLFSVRLASEEWAMVCLVEGGGEGGGTQEAEGLSIERPWRNYFQITPL